MNLNVLFKEIWLILVWESIVHYRRNDYQYTQLKYVISEYLNIVITIKKTLKNIVDVMSHILLLTFNDRSLFIVVMTRRIEKSS